MTQSRTTAAKKTETLQNTDEQTVESVTIDKRKTPTATRRVPVHYTPRIQTVRCPWC